MGQKSIVVTLKFLGAFDQGSAIIYLRSFFLDSFNLNFEEMSYTITDKSTSSWKQKTKTLKFTDQNIEKFTQLHNSLKENIFIDFELLRLLKDYEFKSIDIDLSVTYSSNNGAKDEINTLKFIFNYNNHKNIDFDSFSSNIIDYLSNCNCKVIYGFITCIENKKNPAFYVEGIGNDKISEEEMRKLQTWQREMKNCDKKIWDIFWGNFISTEFLESSPELLSEIERVLDKKNIRKVNSNLYFFRLVGGLEKYNLVNPSNDKIRLLEIFKRKKLVLS